MPPFIQRHDGNPVLLHPASERGTVLIMLLFIITMAGTAWIIRSLDSTAMQIERDKKTTQALSAAKAALLAYAETVNLTTTCTSSTNCPRPGDLPCPDLDNDGSAGTAGSSACGNASGSTGQTLRIGRLPWKTLGTGELTDGYGERLWYAVSNRYKNNTRYIPLNSDTTGTITLRDTAGTVINDGASTTGVVAVIFSAGAPITRQDGISQTRATTAQQNDPVNYLDNALGEDNSSFTDGSGTDGFIMGPIRDTNANEILNDRLLAITRDDLIPVMEARVLAETSNALLDYFCGNAANADYSAKSCIGAGTQFPNPASFLDATCLDNASISWPNCPSNIGTSHGRIPVTMTYGWNSTSILRGSQTGNWFQQNAWREVIHYAAAPACTSGANCAGGAGGFLTLNHTPGSTTGAKAILLATGRTLGIQTRAASVNKLSETNYLEGENLSPLDDVYTWITPTNNTMNDRAASIP